MHEDYDVLIVGGGPAGLSAAHQAARTGARVAVLEKSKEIGYPIHTSGGSWIKELSDLGIPGRFMHPIHVGHFIAPEAQTVFEYADPPSCILDVRGLYQYLAELASQAGAQLFVHSPVVSASLQPNVGWSVKVRRDGHEKRFQSALLIDASGASGFVARRLGLSNGFQRVGLGAEYDLFAPDWPTHQVAFLFGSRFAPSGYAWIFPHADQRVRVGVGIISPDSKSDPKMHLENLLSNQTLFDGQLTHLSRIEYHTGTIPSETLLERTVAERFLVTGDAGGLISILLGEGIRFAIDIGRMAGGVAGEAVKQARYDEGFLSQYEHLWRKKYLTVFRMGAFINKRIAAYSDEQWNMKIKALAKLDPELIPLMLKGEFGLGSLFKIMKASPAIITKMTLLTLKSRLKILDFHE